ncbi:MAG: cytochrome c [Planctomycetota bacterium]|nr:MAG: cytochrome c [Planctomycetota bacterium]
MRRAASSIRSASGAVLGVTLLALLAPMAAGCRGDRTDKPPRQFFPDMDDSPKVKPQTQSYFFEDGRAMREPVAGTVPFGRHASLRPATLEAQRLIAMERDDMLAEDDALYRGVNPDGSYVQRTPVRKVLGLPPGAPVDPRAVLSLVEEGKKQFLINCLPCHGASGDGDGLVGQRWSSPVPSYHQPQYYPGGEKGQDGYIFHVIRNGVANTPGAQPPLRMPSYAENVSPREAWAIVLYIRALQRTRLERLSDAGSSFSDDDGHGAVAASPAAKETTP